MAPCYPAMAAVKSCPDMRPAGRASAPTFPSVFLGHGGSPGQVVRRSAWPPVTGAAGFITEELGELAGIRDSVRERKGRN